MRLELLNPQRSYALLVVLWLTWFWNSSFTFMFVPLMPTIQESLAFSTGAVGLLLGIGNFGSAISYIGSGFINAKLGRRKAIILGTAITSICLLLLSLTSDYFSLLILRFSIGLSSGTYLPAALSTLADLFPTEKLGRYIGFHEMAVPAGMTFGPVFVGLALGRGVSWSRIVQIWVIPATIILISQLLFVREPRREPSHVSTAETERTPKSNSLPIKCLFALIAILSLRGIATAETSLLPTYWVNDLRIEADMAAFIYGISSVFAIVGQVGAGYLSDIFGRLKVLLTIQILGSLLLIPTSYLQFGPPLFVSFAAFSLLSNGFMPVLFVLISERTQPIERAKTIGIVLASGGISNTIGPTLLGLVAGSFSFKMAWIYPIISSFLSIPFLIFLRSQLSLEDRKHTL
jgi:MFS family permease